MTLYRWSPGPPPDELGALAHGPVIVARSPGIVMGLRCVFAHHSGLDLMLVLRARGVQAEAAARRSHQHRDLSDADRWSAPRVVAEVNGTRGIAHSYRATASSGDDQYALDQRCWIGALPANQTITLSCGWPEAGLAEGEVTLTLTGLADLDETVRTLV